MKKPKSNPFSQAKAFAFFARNNRRNPRGIKLKATPIGGEEYREILIQAFRPKISKSANHASVSIELDPKTFELRIS